MPHKGEQSDGDTSALRKIVSKGQAEGMLPEMYRIESLEQSSKDHAESIKMINKTLAEGTVLFNTLQIQAGYMQQSLDNVNKTLKKVMWTIILGILGGIVTAILNGVFKGHP